MVLVHSPFTTAAKWLQPRVLAVAHQATLLGINATVSQGYALALEPGPTPDHPRRAMLMRLADGATAVVEPRPGFHWNWALYVTADEVALVEGADREIFLDAGLRPGESYTIVRRRIESLGLGDPPE